jgi:hypothetical protein
MSFATNQKEIFMGNPELGETEHEESSSAIDSAAAFIGVESLMKAARTEDEIGCVLRSHLVAESIMEKYLVSKTQEKMSRFFKFKDGRMTFSIKIQLCLAFGMPVEFGDFLVGLNKIRNKFGHNVESELNSNDLNELAVTCDKNGWSRDKPVRTKTLEITTDGISKDYRYGDVNRRIDFLIIFITFLPVFSGWAFHFYSRNKIR